ncbi:alpha-mannosidase [Pholiota molesta]|nr:alpha-mannosidase [Pholiota molesta]
MTPSITPTHGLALQVLSNTTPVPRLSALNSSPGAKWIKNLTKDRLGGFNGGHYNDVNLGSVLFTHRLDNPENVKLKVWSAPGLTKPTFEEAMQQKFRTAKKGTPLDHLESLADTAVIVGLSIYPAGGAQGRRTRVHHRIQLQWYVWRALEWRYHPASGHEPLLFSGSADLVVPNMEAWGLLWDFQTLRELVDSLPGNTPLQNKALSAANEIMNVFKKGDPTSITKARKVAEEIFGEGWEAKGAEIYNEGAETLMFGALDSECREEIDYACAEYICNSCHIDSAWLWPYRVTQQKVARSWSTQVDLMERYPEHRFSCSSAQQYKWLEELYPPLFERVKEKVLDGRFHPVGGSWVENDSNMPSGEALVRQFLFGQRYFETRFGQRCDTAWLPDSFGLTGAYPQLIRGAGMKYFFTQKLSWNNINVFPHSTFNWVGIDGTQVLCHMTPVDTYTAQATVGDVNKGLTNHKNLESTDTLSSFSAMLRRIRAVTNNHRELPPVNMGHSVDEFFETIEKDTKEGSTLPNWHGEYILNSIVEPILPWFYKKGNRHSEILLRDVEQVTTWASLLKHTRKNYVYPKEKIDESGRNPRRSSWFIYGMVYDDAEVLYAEVKKDGEALLEEALSLTTPPSSPDGTYQGPLAKAGSGLKAQFSRPRMMAKKVMRLCIAQLWSWRVEAPFKRASRPFKPVSVYTNGTDISFSEMPASVDDFEWSYQQLGSFSSRELIPEGQTGGLVIFQDRPNYWDAWDVEVHHLETVEPLAFTNVSVVSQGPLRAAVRAEVRYGQSTISVTISLEATTVELPLNIHSDNATYETQFGFVQRPTHKNTTWDIAKFEVCGHKYADLSEFGYGVAILSESKYGFSCQGNILRISLLRSATAPDAEQDQGEHRFSWAVMPHEGHFLESDVPIAGYLFNSPLRGARNVILETIKRGEYDSFDAPVNLDEKDSPTTIILRLYEAFGGHAQAKLVISSHLPVVKAFTTNLLEDEDEDLYILRPTEGNESSGTVLSLSFRGFEVKTVKLVLADDTS